MEWLLASVLATLTITAGPLLIAAAVARATGARQRPEIVAALRRLRLATFAAWLWYAVWFAIDHVMVMRGARAVPIAVANVLAFAVLFLRGAMPILSTAKRSPGATPPAAAVNAATPVAGAMPVSPRLRRLVFLFVGVTLALVARALMSSPNDTGYRLKGALIIVAGAALFVFELRRRAPQPADVRTFATALFYFSIFQMAAVLTLGLDFSEPTQRWIGVGAQVAVGVLGFVGCARMLAGGR